MGGRGPEIFTDDPMKSLARIREPTRVMGQNLLNICCQLLQTVPGHIDGQDIHKLVFTRIPNRIELEISL